MTDASDIGSQPTSADDSGTFIILRRHAAFLLVALLVVFIGAFMVYRWIEWNEARSELIALARTLPPEFGSQSAEITQYPGGIIVIRAEEEEVSGRFGRERFVGNDYLTFSTTDGRFIIAKSENELSDEIARMGFLLGGLFVATVVILSGWWALFKDEIREMFTVL